MAMQLRPCYDLGDATTLSSCFGIFSVKKGSTDLCSVKCPHYKKMVIRAQVVMPQLAIMNHRSIIISIVVG